MSQEVIRRRIKILFYADVHSTAEFIRVTKLLQSTVYRITYLNYLDLTYIATVYCVVKPSGYKSLKSTPAPLIIEVVAAKRFDG